MTSGGFLFSRLNQRISSRPSKASPAPLRFATATTLCWTQAIRLWISWLAYTDYLKVLICWYLFLVRCLDAAIMSVSALGRDTAFQARSLVCPYSYPYELYYFFCPWIWLTLRFAMNSSVPFSVNPPSSPRSTSVNTPAAGRRMPSGRTRTRLRTERFKSWFRMDCRTCGWWRLVMAIPGPIPVVRGSGTPLSGRKEEALWYSIDHWSITMAFTDYYLPSEANNYQPILPDGQVGCWGPGDRECQSHCMLPFHSIQFWQLHRESKPEEKVISSVKRILGKIPWPCDFLYASTVRTL